MAVTAIISGGPGPLREGIGSTDCELLRDAALAQPVNAITSFAYVLIAIGIVGVARRRGGLDAGTLVYTACLAGVGIGSVLFHGPQPAGSRLLHDLPITLTVWFIVVHDVWLLRRRDRGALGAFAGVAVVSTAVALVSLDAVMMLTVVGVGAIAVLEALVYRRRARPVGTSEQRRADAVVIGITAVAALTYVLGRTDSPLCAPESYIQLHAVWHLLSGAVFATWWWLAVDLPRQEASTADELTAV